MKVMLSHVMQCYHNLSKVIANMIASTNVKLKFECGKTELVGVGFFEISSVNAGSNTGQHLNISLNVCLKVYFYPNLQSVLIDDPFTTLSTMHHVKCDHTLLCSCTNGKWKKNSSFSGLCDHTTEVHISPATIAGQETLGVSCFACRNIKFYDIERGETTHVYNSPIYVPYGFCPGEPDFLFVFANNDDMNKNQILKLHHESDFFTVCQSFEPDLSLESRRQENLLGSALMKMVDLSSKAICPYSLQFVPNYNLLLLSSSQKGIIQAIDCSTETVAWRHALKPEVEAEVNLGAFYFPESDTILAADGSDHKILVLSPNDGSYMHSIDLFDNVGNLSEIALRGDTIILLHSIKHKEKISFYTISGEHSDDDDIETKRRITKRRLTSRRSGGGSKKS